GGRACRFRADPFDYPARGVALACPCSDSTASTAYPQAAKKPPLKQEGADMKQLFLVPLAMLVSLAAFAAWAQGPQYPSLTEYMMPRDAEVALARSAAPATISGRATIKVLTTAGYQVAHDGDNGFVCMVMRGWSAPTYTPAPFRELVYDASVRAPICF